MSGFICLEHVPNATDAGNYCVAVLLAASRITYTLSVCAPLTLCFTSLSAF